MKYRNMLVGILVVHFLFGLNACWSPSTFGIPSSKSQVKDKEMLKKVRRVCVLWIISATDTSGKGIVLKKVQYAPPPIDSLTLQLWKDLNSRNLFTLIPMDTLQQAARDIQSWDSMSIPTKAGLLSADALLYSKLRIFWNGMWDIPAADLYLALVDPESRKVIAFADHNTAIGNSYFLKSTSVNNIIMDAITGTVDALQGTVNDAKKP